jgi:hypothetical protein
MAPEPFAAAGQSCPIVPALVDGRAARWAAILSLGLLGVMIWRGWGLALLGLALDFGFRAAGLPGFSPVARLAGRLRRLTGLPGESVNAGPKRFAATVGAGFTLAVAAALLAGWRSLGLGLAAVLGFCAALEAGFGFCLACQVYPWLPWARSDR